jgi:hypothetical protein
MMTDDTERLLCTIHNIPLALRVQDGHLIKNRVVIQCETCEAPIIVYLSHDQTYWIWPDTTQGYTHDHETQ